MVLAHFPFMAGRRNNLSRYGTWRLRQRGRVGDSGCCLGCSDDFGSLAVTPTGKLINYFNISSVHDGESVGIR